MAKILDLVFHSDPAHGWLEVPKTLLEELKIKDKITSCSYMDSSNVYLEEDCDMTTFLKAIENSGYRLEYHEQYKPNSPIRHKQQYHPF